MKSRHDENTKINKFKELTDWRELAPLSAVSAIGYDGLRTAAFIYNHR